VLAPRALLIAVGFLAMAGGCWSEECTLKGCPWAFRVDFVKATPWADGTYRVEVNADGVGQTCEVVMPTTCASSSTCQGGQLWLLMASACGVVPPTQAIDGVAFPRHRPTQLAVQVAYEGTVLAAETFKPSYVESRPNGPSCEPTCRTAPPAVLRLP
jgi:hypothetical protein